VKYPVRYNYKIGEGRYYSSGDPDYNQVLEDITKFFKDNSIQHRFVNEKFKGHKAAPGWNPDLGYWRILNETLYFYRDQDRNFFLLHFGHLYEQANV
jgi:hypothetical protein